MRRSKPLSSLSRTLAFAAPAVVLSSTSANADMYLKVDNLNGESVAKTHPKWIEVGAMSFGIENTGNAITGGGKSFASELVIDKFVDSTSPPLFLGCLQGQTFNEVKLEVTKNLTVATVYYRLTLQNVRVTSLKVSNNSANDRPMETVALSFAKILVEYVPVDSKDTPGTPIPANWDFSTNTK